MQITITGPRGCGCTTMTAFIANQLRQRGMQVEIISLKASEVQFTETRSKHGRFDLSRSARVVIVDGCEQEDEESARKI